MIKRLPSEFDTDISHLYGGSVSCVFRKGTDEWGMFGNMTGGYPLYHHGVLWKSSEALYQAARFPDHPDIQEAIRNATNGFTAKLIAKAKIHHTREDWMDVNIPAMVEALYAKIGSNPKLWDVLEKTNDRDIVEHSGKGDTFWGTKLLDDHGETGKVNLYRGQNVLGKCWMFIREKSLRSRTIPTPTPGLLPGKDPFEGFM
jgi:ribA/ribD-fused uncharacterized protein